MFEKLYDGAWQLKIPFENIYTSAFLFMEGTEAVLLDSGSNANDVEQYLLPALCEKGVMPTLLVCSHLHGDHCGGVERLLAEYPTLKVGLFAQESPYPQTRTRFFTDSEELGNGLQVLHLQGHSPDCLAILDKRENVLFSCDCLQARGVGRYPTFYADEEGYVKTIARVRSLGVAGIIASHEYEPYGATYRTSEEIEQFLDECIACVERRRKNP